MGSNLTYIYRVLFSLLCLQLFLLHFTSCAEKPIEYRIWVVQSYENRYAAYEDVEQMIKKGFLKNGIQANLRSFYLDCDQYLEEDEKLRIFMALDSISLWKPALILVNDDQATYSLLACDHPLTDSLPIVFTGVNYPNMPLLKKYPNATGFWDKPDYVTNIKLINRLFGKSRIYRVQDSTYIDRKILADMEEQLKDYPIFIDNTRQSGHELMESKNNIINAQIRLKQTDTMAIYTFQGRKNGGLVWSLGYLSNNSIYLGTKRDYTTVRLGSYSACPSFSVINEDVGYDGGFIGGYMTPLSVQTYEASERAALILKGKPASTFPQISQSAKKYVFDYQTLTKWKIDWKLLPENSLFLDMPFYVRHQTILNILGILLGSIITWTLIYQRIQYRREAFRKRRAEIDLKKEKEFLSLALESGNIYAFRYKNSFFEFENDFYTSLNLPKEPLSIDRFYQVIHPDDRCNFSLEKLKEGFSSRQIIKCRYNFNGKGYLWWEFRYAGNKVTDAQNTEDFIVSGLCLNIQQSKDAEESLIRAREKAEESDRMKSAFLANMSHEIRTPLNAIVGFSSLLATEDSEFDPEQKHEFLDLISKNSDLLLKLINDILDLSRIESGKMSFSFTDCNLTELIEDIFNTHRLLIPENVILRKVVPSKPITLKTDKHRLTQVITNFINNACKFTTQGYIEVGYTYISEARFVQIYVADTGKGIPKDKLAAVFDRFQKLDEFAQGAGLGLSICKIITDRFGGNIQVESEEGQGSKFTISLPIEKLQ